MRIANSRHPWLRRGISGVGFRTPLALAPALRVTVCREVRMADGDRPVDVADLKIDVAPLRTQR